MKYFLDDTLAGARLLDVGIGPVGDEHTRASKRLTDDEGQTIVDVTWRPAQPGARLLRNVAAPLFGLVGVFLTLLAFTYRWGLRSSRCLVESEARAHHLAFHDQLTEIPNRRFFMEELSRVVTRASSLQVKFAVFLVDLDHFKLINDTFGHHCGDELIREAARRLTDTCSSGELCARLGGDEFVILADQCDEASAAILAGRLIVALSEPVHLSLVTLKVGGSIGVSVFRGHEREEVMLRQADAALYRAKEGGRGSYCFHYVDTGPPTERKGNHTQDVEYQPQPSFGLA